MAKTKGFFKNNLKKIIIVGVIIVTAILIYSFFFKEKNASQIISPQELTSLEKKDFVKSVNESGVTKSQDNVEIFAEQALPVEEIKVEVGDKVKKDQILAKLDATKINEQIETTKATMASTGRASSAQIQNARASLAEAQRRLQDGTNPQLVGAENAVVSSYDAWQRAEKAYDDFNRSLKMGYNEAITAKEANDHALENAKARTELNYEQSLDSAGRTAFTAEQARLLAEKKEKEAQKFQKLERDFNLDVKHLSNYIEEALLEIKSGSVNADYQNVLDIFSNIEDYQKEVVSTGKKLIHTRNMENDYYWDKKHSSSSQLVSLEKDFKEACDNLETYENRSSSITNTNNEPEKLKDNIEAMQDELLMMQSNLKDLSGLLAGVQGDYEKYRAQAAAGPDSYEASRKTLEQSALQDKIAKEDLDFSDEQKKKTDMNLQDKLADLRKAADDANHSYQSALKNLEVAKATAQDEISSLKRAVTIAEAGGDTSVSQVQLDFLEDALKKSIIKAPIDGTVTEVNLTKGKVPANYAFKIESVDRLIIESQVKEFDVNSVKVGTPVELTSDALKEDKIFKGKVESVDPVPIKSQGLADTSPSNEVQYKVTIHLDEEDPAIRPGMNMRVKYILDKKKDVFTVPSDAVYEKNGKYFILVLTNGQSAEIKELEVKVDGENDFETIIQSDQLKEGMRVINKPDAYSPGTSVKIGEKAEESKD